MARWLVNHNDTQISADSMAELVELARQGRIGPGDMIQPPGAHDWLYVAEVPELLEAAQASGSSWDDDDDEFAKKGGGAKTAVMAAVLLGIIGAGGWATWTYSQQLPDAQRSLLDQVSFSEMVVTGKNVPLRAEAEAGAAEISTVPDGMVMELLAKRGDFYRARSKSGGAEGWIPVDEVMPMYMIGGKDTMQQYDPLYNPDRYLLVANASWMQLPEQREEMVTVFQFMLNNTSDYDMTDLKMVARIKDAKGHELEQVEFPIEGIVPAKGMTMVGTYVDPDTEERKLMTQTSFQSLAGDDPELQLTYADGVEVQMNTEDFTEASIDIVELRAIPNE